MRGERCERVRKTEAGSVMITAGSFEWRGITRHSGHGGSRGQDSRGVWEERGALTVQEGRQRNGSLHPLSCLKQAGFPNANQTSCYYHIAGVFPQKTQDPASTLSPLGNF